MLSGSLVGAFTTLIQNTARISSRSSRTTRHSTGLRLLLSTMTPQHKPPPISEDDAAIARKVTPDALVECGARLRQGNLVAFPTETVYGLGCHALDPVAVQKVFDAKERPLTDPLIVHVADTKDALELWHDKGPLLEALCQEFWPGPLTLVSKAAPAVPDIIMANTGYVACRYPLHPLAQRLIREAKVPIAAPSANKFGHVSPTRADHVLDDLGKEDVWVLEDNIDNDNNKPSCQVGVESTVAKLDDNTQTLTVLRQGAISVKELKECLVKAGYPNADVASLSDRTVEETQATVAPGQTIKHYSPRIPSFLVATNLTDSQDYSQLCTSLLKESIVLDFGGRLAAQGKQFARRYRDLSPSGDSKEAAQCVFDALRWAERIDDEAKYIVFPRVANAKTQDALTLALHDRLTRAASGVVLDSLESLQQHVPSLQEARP